MEWEKYVVLNCCTLYIDIYIETCKKEKDSHYGMEGEYANHNI